VSGIGDIELFGCGVQMAAGSLLALMLLYSAELGIALAGCIGIGFVIGIGDGNVSMTMAEYAMAGLAGGALKGFGRIAAAGGFAVGIVGMLLCFDPYGELWYRMGEALIGCGLFLAVPHRYSRELRSYLVEVAVGERAEQRVGRVRDKLSAMASLLARIADSRRGQRIMTESADNQAQAAAILAAVEETACSVCEKRKDCWEDDFFAVSQEVLSLGTSGGDEALVRRCPSAKAIGESIERVIRREAESGYWRVQCAEQQSLLAKQMRSLGAILQQMETELEPLQELRRRQKEKIANRLSAWGCRAEELTIGETGESSRIELICPSCGGKRLCETRVLPFLQQVLGIRLRMSVLCGAQNHLRRCRMFFVSQESVQILTGTAGISARADEPSGDTCEIIALSQGQTAILLSDGTGCGQAASGDSRESVELLRELLEAGFSAETSVRTVNSLLLLRDDRERYATLDVLIINKFTGEAEFIKLGAPPSFIKRQSEVMVMRDDVLPLGIVEQPIVRPIRASLENGDYIVMMSDGILDIPEERLPSGHTKESWVRSQVRLFSGSSPQALAEHLVEMAMRLSGRTIHDDMTVAVVKIKTLSRV
ncbi:MAG: SpoIIE family protein phosphatase, partial [Selenomonadales bacterium]|nr:SpoIIE family protein phosphatase [Selenomonadales bacterium]